MKNKIITWTVAICFLAAISTGAFLSLEIIGRSFPNLSLWIANLTNSTLCGPDGCLGDQLEIYAAIYLISSSILLFRYHHMFGIEGEKLK